MTAIAVLHANDISCNHCAMTIKRELGALEGVLSVEVDVPAKNVSVSARDEAVLDQVKTLLDEIGYPVD